VDVVDEDIVDVVLEDCWLTVNPTEEFRGQRSAQMASLALRNCPPPPGVQSPKLLLLFDARVDLLDCREISSGENVQERSLAASTVTSASLL
jgi:hypothetical protein